MTKNNLVSSKKNNLVSSKKNNSVSSKKSFVQIPEEIGEKREGWKILWDVSILEKKLSLRAIYMYAKMLMLKGKIYNRESWVTNPYTGRKEMSIDALSDITKHLEAAEMIRIVPVETKKSRYKTNTYEVIPQPRRYYKPVAFDFINLDLSAEAKGLAIMMCLLKEIPSSEKAIAKAIGISTKTVSKYIKELETERVEDGVSKCIYDKKNRCLSEDYFPFKKQIREKWERRNQEFIESYHKTMAIWENDHDHPFFQGMIKWIKKLNEPEIVKAYLWGATMMGTLFNKLNKKQEKEEKKIYPVIRL